MQSNSSGSVTWYYTHKSHLNFVQNKTLSLVITQVRPRFNLLPSLVQLLPRVQSSRVFSLVVSSSEGWKRRVKLGIVGRLTMNLAMRLSREVRKNTRLEENEKKRKRTVFQSRQSWTHSMLILTYLTLVKLLFIISDGIPDELWMDFSNKILVQLESGLKLLPNPTRNPAFYHKEHPNLN